MVSSSDFETVLGLAPWAQQQKLNVQPASSSTDSREVTLQKHLHSWQAKGKRAALQFGALTRPRGVALLLCMAQPHHELMHVVCRCYSCHSCGHRSLLSH